MKNYRITVNGTAYDVAVEELGGSAASASAPAAAPVAAAPAAAAPAAPAPSAGAGSITVTAPMPGKILAVKASVGQAVKKGDVVLILEAMKMENNLSTPVSGKVKRIFVNEGDAVPAGSVMMEIE